MSYAPETLGIIAGNRSLPLVLAREARDAGVQRLVAAAFDKETDPHLEALVDEMEWLRVGQLGKLVEVFQKHGVTQCVMVGQIAPKNLFDLRPDLRALKLLATFNEKSPYSETAESSAETSCSSSPAERTRMPSGSISSNHL